MSRDMTSQIRVAAVVSLTLCVLLPPRTAVAQRAASPADATVFIRVFGDVRAEFLGALGSRVEERAGIAVSSGTGFVVSPFGYIVTAHHVVVGGDSVEEVAGGLVRRTVDVTRLEVVFQQVPSGSATTTFVATVMATQPELDLAILSISAGGLPYLALGDSGALTVGQAVRALGYPFGGAIDELLNTQTPGGAPRISASAGTLSSIRERTAGTEPMQYLQTDAVINPGNSGGPLVDDDGYVIGVVQMEVNAAGRETRLGFAIGVNHVTTLAESIGLDQFLPVPRLRLGPVQGFDGRALRLRVPVGALIRPSSRLSVRVDFDVPDNPLALRIDRIWSSWSPRQLEGLLLTRGAFEELALTRGTGSRGRATDTGVVGSVRGVDALGRLMQMEYAVVSVADEHLVARYVGPPDLLAFNRSVLRASLDSLDADPLLVDRFDSPRALALTPGPFLPPGPVVRLPAGWILDTEQPLSCGGGSAPQSWVGASPADDFTVSIRLAWWSAARPDPATRAAACGGARNPGSPPTYRARTERYGVAYATEGGFLAPTNGGVLQYELLAPERSFPAVRQSLAAWLAGPVE